MGKTQHGIGRDDKAKAILAVARGLFIQEGYDGISMSRLAKKADVAPNTLYWYYADKDALLLAVLDAVLAEALSELGRQRKGAFEARLSWLIDKLESVQTLISTVHARANISERVREWHEGFHRLFEAYVLEQLREAGLQEADAAPASRLFAYSVEGLLSHPCPPSERRAFIRFLIESIGSRTPAPRKRTARKALRRQAS